MCSLTVLKLNRRSFRPFGVFLASTIPNFLTTTPANLEKEFEEKMISFENKSGQKVGQFLQDWDALALALSTKESQLVSVEAEFYVLKEFQIAANNGIQEFSVDIAHSRTVVSVPSNIRGSSMTLGVLKSAHRSIPLSHDVVKDSDMDVNSYEFGSRIAAVNLIDKGGESVPLHNAQLINITFPLLPEVDQNTETTNGALFCSYFDLSGYWSREGCNIASFNKNQVTCSCNHLTSFAVLMQIIEVEIPQKHQDALHYLTIICIAISSVCLILTLAFYGYLRLYKKTHIIIHGNLALSMLIGELVFMFGIDTTPKSACIAVTVLLHYFYMALFMWMLMEGVFLYIKMKPTIQWTMKPSVCMAVAWGVPLPITMSTFAVRFHYYGSNGICWLPISHGIIYAFAGPALCIVAINACILYATLKTFRGLRNMRDRSEKERLKASARALVILEPLLGLTWVFGVLQFDTVTAVFFSYLFVILNTSQGVFIFIFQCLVDEEVAKLLRQRFCRRKDRRVGNSSGNSESTEMSVILRRGRRGK